MELGCSSNSRGSKSPKSSLLGDEDRISRLPDVLLHHILCFLDTKFAVRTCLLSRRWRKVWVSLPVLNFNFRVFCDYPTRKPSSDLEKQFIHFIDEVFSHHDDSDIHKFSLVYEKQKEIRKDTVSQQQLKSWILALVSHNIQELYLDVYSDEYIDLPDSLFTCETLTTLKLKVGDLDIDTPYDLPDLIDLPRLRELHLELISFLWEEHDLTELLIKCPLLETLSLSDCDTRPSTLDISSPSLKHLKIKQGSWMGVENTLKLFTPSLISISLQGFNNIVHPPQGLPSLLHAEMGFVDEFEWLYPSGYDKDRWANLISFLTTACNVKILVLSALMIKVALQPVALKTLPTIQLRFLRSMHLHSWLSKGCIQSIIYLLRISPNIKTLILQLEVSPRNLLDGEGDFQVNGQIVLYHLMYVEIRGVRGSVNELKFLEILIKNAAVLKKLVIFISEELSPPDRKERVESFGKKLLDFPRASSNIAMLIF